MSDIKTGLFLKKLPEIFNTQNSIIVTDSNVDRIYGKYFSDFRKIVLPPGEKSKNLKSVESVYTGFLENGIERSSLVIGIGGGVICDITGFAASTYLRGVRFGFFPTTLLAQVDAAIGGKNGVNLRGYKNLVGTFNLPEFIYVDTTFLTSLEESEYQNGVSEILKYGFIRDGDFLETLVENREGILNRDENTMNRIIDRSLRVKTGIVKRDERERNIRRNLNFGHTFGHAFEKLLKISHGQAVSAGMVLAAEFSVFRGILGKESGKKVKDLISLFGLPVKFSVSPGKLFRVIKKDKKRDGDDIYFVFLESIGKSVVKKTDLEILKGFIHDMC